MEPLYQQLKSALDLVNSHIERDELIDLLEERFIAILEDARAKLESGNEEMIDTFLKNPTYIDQLMQLIDKRLEEVQIVSIYFNDLLYLLEEKPSLNEQLQLLYDFIKDKNESSFTTKEFEERVKPVCDNASSILGTDRERETLSDSPDIYELLDLIEKKLNEFKIKSDLFDRLKNAAMNY